MESVTVKTPKKREKRYRRVTLSRSAGGTILIFAFLILIGAFMVLPLLYVLVTAFKPLNEILTYPPKFFVRYPTLSNFRDLIERTLVRYDRLPVGVVGGFGCACRAELERLGAEYGLTFSRFIPSPMEGLIEYHGV